MHTFFKDEKQKTKPVSKEIWNNEFADEKETVNNIYIHCHMI